MALHLRIKIQFGHNLQPNIPVREIIESISCVLYIIISSLIATIVIISAVTCCILNEWMYATVRNTIYYHTKLQHQFRPWLYTPKSVSPCNTTSKNTYCFVLLVNTTRWFICKIYSEWDEENKQLLAYTLRPMVRISQPCHERKLRIRSTVHWFYSHITTGD